MTKEIAVYIHVPFCSSKCHYCDFASFAGINHLMEPYLNALLEELAASRNVHGGSKASSIFIGGGTPSMLSPEMTEKIMKSVVDVFPPSLSAEISIEVNPDSVTEAVLKRYQEIGFNRLSIGVQSFNDRLLKNLGRAHDSHKATTAFGSARRAGFNNISVDLIFGIQDQTSKDFNADLERAISLGPDHISTYQLTVEEGTPLWEMSAAGTIKLPEDDKQLEMYETAIKVLKNAGYIHYEVSNFAKPGKECRHNIAYWMGDEFIGYGNGAHSFIEGCRYANPDDPEDYIYEIDTAGRAGVEILADEEDKALDYLLMRLRLVGKKLSFNDLNDRFPHLEYVHGSVASHPSGFKAVYSTALEWGEKNGLIDVDSEGFCLTHKGLLFLDELLLHFERA
jgi:oxygen-independent coproporphyrinogen-3 oxidase